MNAEPIGERDNEDMIMACGKRGGLPSTATRRGVPGWRKGLSIRISESDQEAWCVECWVFVMLDVT